MFTRNRNGIVHKCWKPWIKNGEATTLSGHNVLPKFELKLWKVDEVFLRVCSISLLQYNSKYRNHFLWNATNFFWRLWILEALWGWSCVKCKWHTSVWSTPPFLTRRVISSRHIETHIPKLPWSTKQAVLHKANELYQTPNIYSVVLIFRCHSFGLNSGFRHLLHFWRASIECSQLLLDFHNTIHCLSQMNELPLDFHSSMNLASTSLPLPLLFCDPVNISCLLFTDLEMILEEIL